MKPRNHVARAQQSGAGKHKDKNDTAMEIALRRAFEEAKDIMRERNAMTTPNNVRGKDGH
jgi:hypothetical protein